MPDSYAKSDDREQIKYDFMGLAEETVEEA
jgi:hypothetical protein